MSNVRIHHGDWIVVCDGAKALILENTGDATFPNLRKREVFAQDDLPTHEQGTAPPGRAFSPSNGARSAMEQTDWHDLAEQEFLRKLAARLDAALMAGEVKALIVAAPPRALGVLRQAYSAGLRKAVQAEIDKDFVKMPVYEIEKHLAA